MVECPRNRIFLSQRNEQKQKDKVSIWGKIFTIIIFWLIIIPAIVLWLMILGLAMIFVDKERINDSIY